MKVTESWLLDGTLLDRDPEEGTPLHWTLVMSPGEEDLDGPMAKVLETIGISRATGEHLLGGPRPGVRRPTLRHRDETSAVSLRLLDYDDSTDAVESGEEWLFVRGDKAVSVVRPPTRGASSVAPSVVPTTLPSVGGAVADLLHGLLLAALDGYEAVLDELQIDVDEIEVSVFSPRRNDDAERIYLLKREVTEARRAVVPLIDLLQRRVGQDPVLGVWCQHRGAVDVQERLHRVAEQVETLEVLLTSILDSYVARVSVQQNEDMRKISAGAALIVVPTFLAGVWGMNFRHMPELRWELGYPMALGTMLLSVSVIWWAFRRAGWF